MAGAQGIHVALLHVFHDLEEILLWLAGAT